ncbi:hypothetical protein [Bradyrhizobium tropiciagri]|nr:hypothetical protein [Bradyrhizobium tropiciagri]
MVTGSDLPAEALPRGEVDRVMLAGEGNLDVLESLRNSKIEVGADTP